MLLARSIAFNIAMFGSGLILSLYGTALKYLAPARLPGLGRFWARFTLAALRVCCNIDLQITGAENLPRGQGAIIAAQHQSALDIMVWLSLLDAPAYVMKQELLRIPLFGPLLLPAGMIAVDRAGAAGALRKMVAECRLAVAAGRPIVIFPEGTRVAPGARVPLQPGIVALAKALGVPVIPAGTNSGTRWGRLAFRKTPGSVRLTILPALPPSLPREAILDALETCFYGPPEPPPAD